jgi:predicted membrane protein
LLALCGFQLLAVAIGLTCSKRLFITVVLFVIGLLICPATYDLFAPVYSLFTSALFTNILGLVFILAAFLWIHYSIAHSTRLYQLKSEDKQNQGSL